MATASWMNFSMAVAWDEFAAGAGPVVTAALKAAAPGSGNHTSTITSSRGSLSIRWTGSANPWQFVTRGTKAHLIQPKTASVLHWVGPGGDVFARSVNHPGNKANKFPLTAWRNALPTVRPLLNAALRKGLVLRQPNPFRATF